VATIGIDIKTNFDEAASQLKAFTGVTQAETDRINANLKRLDAWEADKFVQKNKQVALSVGATRGTIAALETEQRGLERRMQTLIRNGMDPQDAALIKLQDEYNRTTKQIEINAKAQKINETASKAATRTMQAMGVAAVGVGIALLKNAQDVAKRGDTYAKQAAIIGTTAEELQKLNYVADLAGVPQEALANAMKKLNKNMGDARMGTGELKTLLEKTNPALLAQLNATTDSAAAFDLMIDAMHKTTNAQDRAALATAAFGKAGQGLINISSMSAEEIKKLKDEAVKYGIISNASAKSAEDFMDAQTRMKAAITGVRNALGTALMPIIQSIVEGITRFVGDGEKMKSLFKTLIPLIVGVGGALAGMMIINKVNGLIEGFKTSMKALKVVLAAHPIMLLVGGVAALAAIFFSGGKSAAEFEKEISEAEKTSKALADSMRGQGQAFDAFVSATRGAVQGSRQYQEALDKLLKSTPELTQYGITAASSFQDVAAAQKMLTDAQQAANMVKADEQYRKLADGLDELKGAVTLAWDAYQRDPTQANLAAAKNYAAQLKRSEVAMQSLGQQSGRSADEVSATFNAARANMGGFSASADMAADAVKGIGKASLLTQQQLQQMVLATVPGMQMIAGLLGKMQQKKIDPFVSGGKPRDMSKEIRDLQDANNLRLSLAGDYEKKRQQLILAAERKVQDMAGNTYANQRAAMDLEIQKKLYADLDDLMLDHMRKKEEVAKKIEEEITRQQQEEQRKRMEFAGQMLEGLSSILGAVGGLYQAQSAAQIAALEERQKKELEVTKLTDKEKEALQKEHEKQKAKIEYDAALKSWKLQVAAGIADGARAILSALNTKPFIPAGLAAAAVATAMTGIQLATLKASKPKLSAETGGRFTVPDNAGSARGDSQNIRVNPGETIDVTPRGEGRKLVVNNYLDKRLLWSVMQDGIDSGVITVTADNLVAV
jgi:hypothetical protein